LDSSAGAALVYSLSRAGVAEVVTMVGSSPLPIPARDYASPGVSHIDDQETATTAPALPSTPGSAGSGPNGLYAPPGRTPHTLEALS
jgi:hypothetical protein